MYKYIYNNIIFYGSSRFFKFVNGKQNVSTIVTHKTSDWSVVELDEAPKSIWVKAVRRLEWARKQK